MLIFIIIFIAKICKIITIHIQLNHYNKISECESREINSHSKSKYRLCLSHLNPFYSLVYYLLPTIGESLFLFQKKMNRHSETGASNAVCDDIMVFTFRYIYIRHQERNDFPSLLYITKKNFRIQLTP